MHVAAHGGKFLPGVGVVTGKVHQPVQPALLLHNAAALGKDQPVHQRDVSHHIVHRRPFQRPQHRVVVIKGLFHLRRNRRTAQRGGGDIVDLLQRGFHIHPQDVDLVRVPQQVAVQKRPDVQILRQPVGAVQLHRPAQQPVLAAVVQIVPDVSLRKQHLGAAGGMVDGGSIVEGTMPAQLLEPAHVVQKPAQPGQVNTGGVQALGRGNPRTKTRHPVGVVNFQLYLGVPVIVPGSVGGKGTQCLVSVDLHGISPPEKNKTVSALYHAGVFLLTLSPCGKTTFQRVFCRKN